MITIEKAGLSDKELAFLKRWSSIRKKGRARYIGSRGFLIGILLFAVWFVITMIEINTSEFEKALYTQYVSAFVKKCVIWFVSYMIIGCVIASGMWKQKEEKMNYLS
ncbi:hypothetical protein ACFFNY_08900 [Paenibacillus hodogayensis]|uniref:DUF1206 domain-containing protein n=1 Tax=Paenibacillus hodogayensis TaxID=279208 RepID=A0ABV5VTQ5_9BACL